MALLFLHFVCYIIADDIMSVNEHEDIERQALSVNIYL